MSFDSEHVALRDAFREGLPATTVELAKQLLAYDPGNLRAQQLLALSLQGMARYDEAQKIYKEFLDASTGTRCAIVRRQLGVLYQDKGDFNKAEKWFQAAIADDPDHATGYVCLGGLYAKRGMLREAEEVHRRGTTCSNGAVDEAWLTLGYVLRAQEHYTEAVECFERALEIDPEHSAANDALKDVQLAITETAV